MKLAFALILILSAAQAMAGLNSIEFATGIGSPYWVTNDNWRGSVGGDGLYFKEYSARAEYSFSRVWGISASAGWIHYKDISARMIADYYWHKTPTRKCTYLLPALIMNTDELRVNIGTIIYRTNDRNKGENYPFNNGNKLWPSLRVELGTEEFYLLGGFFNSLPLLSECIEIGFGRKFSGVYDHSIFLFRGSINNNSIGYRGEFRVFRQNALILGISAGGDENRREIYTFTLGIKFNFRHNALSYSDL